MPGKTDSTGYSPRYIVSFKPNDNWQLNAQVSKGFRLGGINDPINLPLCSADDRLVFGNQGTWKDERNTNYEIGAKMRTSDRRYTLNVAAFYSDIKDLQATTTAGTCSSRIVFNVPKAHSQGLEAEFYGRPAEHWDFGLSVSIIDASLNSSVTSTNCERHDGRRRRPRGWQSAPDRFEVPGGGEPRLHDADHGRVEGSLCEPGVAAHGLVLLAV